MDIYTEVPSATSNPKCEGSGTAGMYSNDSALGMVYLCPVCKRTFLYLPYWTMNAGDNLAAFVVPYHSA